MEQIEPFGHLELVDDDASEQFISLWHFDCLKDCLVGEKRKQIDVYSDCPIQECFDSQWFLISNKDDLSIIYESINHFFNYNFSNRVYTVQRLNKDYNEKFFAALGRLVDSLVTNQEQRETFAFENKRTILLEVLDFSGKKFHILNIYY